MDEQREDMGRRNIPQYMEDMTDLERIQAEISRDLYTKKPEVAAEVAPMPELALTSDVTPAVEVSTTTASAGTEFPTPVAVESSPVLASAAISETVKNQTKKRGASRLRRTVAIVALAAVLGGGSLGFGIGLGIPVAQHYFVPAPSEQPREPFSFQEKDALPTASGNVVVTEGEGYADLIERVEPSVVVIETKYNVTSMLNIPAEGNGMGSGVIFHEDNDYVYVATNAHVVDGASGVTVRISGAEGVAAKLVGKEVVSDLAVISISKADLSKVGINRVVVASFGDSEKARVGDIVLAIGNANGEGITATNGMISAKNREITTEMADLTVLQTNAAINPGNSGGAIINIKGEVIGITTAKLAQINPGGNPNSPDYAEGTGYAIPSNTAKPILENLMNATPKPKLGITVSNMTEQFAKQFNLPMAGAIVESVVVGSCAEAAGIKRTDVITGFNGLPILTKEQLIEAVGATEIGQKVEVKLIRDGKETLTITVTMTVLPQTGF